MFNSVATINKWMFVIGAVLAIQVGIPVVTYMKGEEQLNLSYQVYKCVALLVAFVALGVRANYLTKRYGRPGKSEVYVNIDQVSQKDRMQCARRHGHKYL